MYIVYWKVAMNKKGALLPDKDVNDERFLWLKDEFLHYLSEWHKSIREQPGNFDKNEQAQMFLSHQTYEGVKVSIYSVIALVIPAWCWDPVCFDHPLLPRSCPAIFWKAERYL